MDVTALKSKAIKDYQEFISYLLNGNIYDYQFILEEVLLIKLIEDNLINSELSLYFLQYYLNNKWLTKQY